MSCKFIKRTKHITKLTTQINPQKFHHKGTRTARALLYQGQHFDVNFGKKIWEFQNYYCKSNTLNNVFNFCTKFEFENTGHGTRETQGVRRGMLKNVPTFATVYNANSCMKWQNSQVITQYTLLMGSILDTRLMHIV